MVEFALLGCPPFIQWPVLPPFPIPYPERQGSVGFAVYRKKWSDPLVFNYIFFSKVLLCSFFFGFILFVMVISRTHLRSSALPDLWIWRVRASSTKPLWGLTGSGAITF